MHLAFQTVRSACTRFDLFYFLFRFSASVSCASDSVPCEIRVSFVCWESSDNNKFPSGEKNQKSIKTHEHTKRIFKKQNKQQQQQQNSLVFFPAYMGGICVQSMSPLHECRIERTRLCREKFVFTVAVHGSLGLPGWRLSRVFTLL